MRHLSRFLFCLVLTCIFCSVLPISMATSSVVDVLNVKGVNSTVSNDFNNPMVKNNTHTHKIINTTQKDPMMDRKINNSNKVNKSIIDSNHSKSDENKTIGHTIVWKYVTTWELGWYTVGPEYYWVPWFPGERKPYRHNGDIMMYMDTSKSG